jgi:hypothetical protein
MSLDVILQTNIFPNIEQMIRTFDTIITPDTSLITKIPLV